MSHALYINRGRIRDRPFWVHGPSFRTAVFMYGECPCNNERHILIIPYSLRDHGDVYIMHSLYLLGCDCAFDDGFADKCVALTEPFLTCPYMHAPLCVNLASSSCVQISILGCSMDQKQVGPSPYTRGRNVSVSLHAYRL
jgi:hypothetical protein